MRQFAGIVKNTVLSIRRSSSFYLLVIFLLSASLLLPWYIQSTGVPSEDISTSIDYSISIVSLMVFISAIWTSCIEMNYDLEGHQIHLVFVKPVNRAIIWVGKFSGILLIHVIFLLFSFSIIYSVIIYRVSHSGYRDYDIRKINEEVLVGRKTIFPEIPGLNEEISSELRKKLDTAFEKNEPLSDVKIEELKQNIMTDILFKRGEIKPGTSRLFEYRNIKSGCNDIILEYKIFIGQIDLVERQIRPSSLVKWAVKNGMENSYTDVYESPEKIVTNKEYRVGLPQVQVTDHMVILKFENPNPSISLFFQLTESPVIKVKYSGFLSNYSRGMVLVLLGLVFVTALGCALGGFLSFPIASFAILSYLIIGLISGMIYSNTTELNQNLSFQTKIGYLINNIIQKLVPTIQNFQPSELISAGRLIEWSYITAIIRNNLLVHGVIIVAAGIILYSIREAGLIKKK